MSNVDVANAAGVTAEYVRKVRQQQESRLSNQQLDSEPIPKVKTSRGIESLKWKFQFRIASQGENKPGAIGR